MTQAILVFVLIAADLAGKDLSHHEAKELRRILYDIGVTTVFPDRGKYENTTIMLVPSSIVSLYNDKPYYLIKHLTAEIQKAPEKQARYAYALIYALILDNPQYALVHTTVVGKYDIDPQSFRSRHLAVSHYLLLNTAAIRELRCLSKKKE